MADDPMAIEAAQIRAQQVIEKAAADGVPFDDMADFAVDFFLRLERCIVIDTQVSPPDVREAMVAAALQRIASSESAT